ncbi:hypothetical protein BO86DRAFT_24896 [Aspergillus japonicus CBS 114.51]|uniref:Clr5 domain-containing protein n=1 Tax=Aspergillus japonicus CBS 114.51 TaxID=1448312 RepID=A0A8T8X7M2_ASPJA|nr:hypothetical protein BO86DRAFT_24896 [Aspergillus japonicus CBS 114.51]RAH83980.1 hypothetical protein BO86DRAFT_24896 [Aspergillus japonicus CBS 114.51]
MKNSIPSDVWERKKALIAQLYKDEEWPLKQVIKKIRSDDFNPSETQLRSRLKKWRVTKPSRQTRKKSNDSQQEGSGDDSGREGGSPKHQAAIVSSKSRATATDLSVSESDWFMNGSFAPEEELPVTVSLDHAWAPVLAQQSPLSQPNKQRDASHASMTSPLLDDVMVNPTASLAPTFQEHPYGFTTESCMQTPVSSSAPAAPIQWSIPQWYSMPMAPGAQSPSMPFYSSAPLSPPIDPAMQLMSPPGPQRVYTPQTPPTANISRQQLSDLQNDGAQLWKRAMSAPYVQDTAGGHPTLEQRSMQSTAVDRKASLPSKATSPHNMGLMTPPPSFFPHGQHPAMCAPIYTYPGAETLIHRPPSIDF